MCVMGVGRASPRLSQVLLSFFQTLLSGIAEDPMANRTGQHCTPHVTRKGKLFKDYALSGSEEAKGSRRCERGTEEKEERKKVSVEARRKRRG